MTNFNGIPVVEHDDKEESSFALPVVVIDDWEATCAIYSDVETTTLVRASNNNNNTTGNKKTVQGLIASISLPIPEVERITFGRRIQHTASSKQSNGTRSGGSSYRFWALPPSQYPVLSVTFHYIVGSCDNDGNGNNNVESSSCSSPPIRVHVELATPYPHSWPSRDEVEWIQWLQRGASKRLREEELSYAVLSWMQSNSLEYFGRLFHPAGGEEEVGLLWFDDPGPSFYDVDTIIMHNPENASTQGLIRQLANSGKMEQTTCQEVWPFPNEPPQPGQLHPFLLHWWKWMPIQCPICLEEFVDDDMEMVTCNHRFCSDCLRGYATSKVDEINAHRDNPFRCPITTCRVGWKVYGCVKRYLKPSQMDAVRAWYKNLKHPPCHSLTVCLSKKCGAQNAMRKREVDSAIVSCDVCKGTWCEWCVQRVREYTHDDEGKRVYKHDVCKAEVCVEFCQRYMKASAEARAKCEAKWPWIKTYAKSRFDDDTVVRWLKAEGAQTCPKCKTGVERVAGCFHIHCACGAHFCYECGEELFYPFYGTHHCWEQQRGNDNNQEDANFFT